MLDIFLKLFILNCIQIPSTFHRWQYVPYPSEKPGSLAVSFNKCLWKTRNKSSLFELSCSLWQDDRGSLVNQGNRWNNNELMLVHPSGFALDLFIQRQICYVDACFLKTGYMKKIPFKSAEKKMKKYVIYKCAKFPFPVAENALCSCLLPL